MLAAHGQEITELQSRLAFFRENQRLLSDGEDESKSNLKQIHDLKE